MLSRTTSSGFGRGLELIRAEGDAQTIGVAEKQADAATEECYDAWRAMNEHDCVATCKPGLTNPAASVGAGFDHATQRLIYARRSRVLPGAPNRASARDRRWTTERPAEIRFLSPASPPLRRGGRNLRRTHRPGNDCRSAGAIQRGSRISRSSFHRSPDPGRSWAAHSIRTAIRGPRLAP